MPVITISRQSGSLGDEIGTAVAASLGLRLVDQDVINVVAQRLGVPVTAVSDLDEPDSNLVAELVRTMRRLYPATYTPVTPTAGDLDESVYLQVLRQTVWEVARAGNIVIMGRGASFILGQGPDTLHVLVVAPRAVRIERVMASLELSASEAAKHIRESDAHRARYARHYYRANWLDADQYDLVVNTGHFSQLRATKLVSTAAQGDKDM